IAATSSTPIFYEYSTQGILLRTWGELGTNENQFYYIRSVYAEDGCLSVADNHFGITLLNLSTTQIITRFTSPSGPSECFQLFHTPNGDFFYLDSNNLVYKLSNSGQKLTRWTEPDENKDSTIGSMIPLNATHLALAVEQIDQITGNTSYHSAIYGFNHSRPSRPTVTPLNQTHPFQNLTLTWTPSIDLDGTVNLYQFELALDPGFIHLVDSGDTPDPSFFFEFLENDTIFFFRVRAQDNDQWFSSWSPTVSTRILVTSQPPDLPPALFLETLIALIIILPLIGGLSLLIDRKSRGTK
ncbi:MAG: fibronectin type III domain-containing protein, partial [Candidatus Thorarchaeota archaeon]